MRLTTVLVRVYTKQLENAIHHIIISSPPKDSLVTFDSPKVTKRLSPSQCGRSHYPSRTTENSVKAETIRSLPFSGGSLRNISKALSTPRPRNFHVVGRR